MKYQEVQFPDSRITVVRWAFDDRDGASHDARSAYVEQFWLGVLGPSATLLLRHINNELAQSPRGFVLHYEELAAQLGLSGTGKNSPFMRSLARLCMFDMARMTPDSRLAVRQLVPSLSNRHLARLPANLRARHDFLVSRLQPV